MAQTFAPSATYGNSNIKNRVKPGGDLGSNQYFYITNASTGKIDVYRHTENKADGAVSTVVVGNIPQGGKFTPNSNASSAEKTHYSSSREIGKVRSQALQVARREWDGKTQPPPTQAIYGTNSGNVGYTPPGSGTAQSSTKGVQNSGYSTDSGNFSNTRDVLKNNLRNLASRGARAGLRSLLGGGGSGGALVYPSTLRRSGNAQDYILIEMLKYEPKKKTGYTWSKRSGDRKSEERIILPIPGGISDANSVGWGEDKMDPVQTAMANLALAGIEGGGKEFAAAGKQIGEQIKNNKEQVKKGLSNTIAGMASGTGSQLLTRTTGNIINPNMELLFKNPSLRPFTFTWKLAARNEDEANAIIRIINTFKRGMAPQTAGENLFLKSPHTWRLSYKHKGRDHKYLNKFKECAMNSITTQYTPDGNYATFRTGHMTAYSITLSFTELEPIFSNDYNGVQGIGY